MSILARVRTLLSALLVLAAAMPAAAQLDPRLQQGSTDLLDVYKTTPANPELLTVYDFSGSMHAVYWDKRYYANPAQDNHADKWGIAAQDPGSEFPGIVPLVDASGQVYLAAGTGYRNDVRTTGRFGQIILPLGVDNSGTGRLIAPDGSVISLGTGTLAEAIQKASHVRITATDGTVTRTVDLPIPWTVLDDKLSSSDASATKVILVDPKGGPSIPPDAVCDPVHASNKTTALGNLLNDQITDASVARGGTGKTFRKIGRLHYTRDYLWWVFFGTKVRNATNDGEDDTGKFIIPEASTAPAWKNGLSGMTRYQALKYATVVAWFANQDKVWWGIRFLDNAENGMTTINANNGNAATPQTDRNINLLRSAQNANVNSMLAAFTEFVPSTSTPLTFAMANAYMQTAYTSDSGSTFGTSSGGGQSGTEKPIPVCRESFVVVFTDGIANDVKSGGGSAIGSGDPYHQTSGGLPTNTRQAGNSALAGYGGLAALNPGSSLFNIWTLAGVAAQYDVTPPWLGPGDTKAYSVSRYAPWRVTSRGATPAAPRKIRTMTVGMSLAGSTKDTASGKADLFRAALYGNPKATAWDLNTLPFDADIPGRDDPSVNPFFFDAYSVEALSKAMTAVLAEVTSGSASIAAPASPLVGLSLGSQVYLGLFQTNKGPRWLGDLLMAGLYVGPTGVMFVDKTGTAVQNITDENAVWSANLHVFGAAGGRNWTTRNLYTNFSPGSKSTNTTTLVPLDEATITDPASVGAGTDDALRKTYIRFLRGASSTDEDGSKILTPTFTGNRPDIMGDIIDSSPGVLEYPISALTSSVSPKLAGLVGSVPSGSTPRFRVIFVGDNQGVFHAFGELSWTVRGKIKYKSVVTDPVTGEASIEEKEVDGQIPYGEVDELWAFVPGEYLHRISALRGKSNPHRYTVNGSPTIYFKDVPASGQVRGNGLVDGSDVVRVVIGQKKGGRSYYAFDFTDLERVVANSGSVMSWKLVPDEYGSGATGQQKVLRHMGFSTTTPALARVDIGINLNQDLVFLGGGLSTAEVDGAFATDFGVAGTKLGRSVVAFDVVNGPGTSLYTWDFTDPTFTATFGAMGCVSASVQPLEFFPGSGHTQRVYFSDAPTLPNTLATRGSGVWALGSTNLASNGVIRLDSSDINTWTGGSTASSTQGIRKVFQAAKGFSVTTTPTPFLLPNAYPAIRSTDPMTAPVAVGLAFGTGDRNDPMDNDAVNPAAVSAVGKITAPYYNWLNVVFDRQDSRSLSGLTGVSTLNADLFGLQEGVAATDGDLADLTTVSSFIGTFNGYSVDPSNSAYYLKSKPGYKLKVGAATIRDSAAPTYHFPKVITNTAVLNGVLFFSGFFPGGGAAGACQGTGYTNTYRICNVMQPTFNSGNTTAASTTFNGGDPTCTGIVLTYPNLPGEITALGTAAIVQSGQGTVNGEPGTISNAGAQVGGSFGKTSGFGFKPRSWRIIR